MKMLFAAASAALALSAVALAEDAMPADRGLSTLPAGDYVMDKTHGYVFMTYSHLGFSNPTIRFADVDANVSLNADDVTKSTLTVSIDPAKIDSGVEKFNNHLMSADLFDVANHGEITFVSKSINMDTEYSGTLDGDLTIKGVTKPVTLDVTLNRAAPHPFTGAQAFGITATAKVNRSDFGLNYGIPVVSDAVDLRIEAEFSKK